MSRLLQNVDHFNQVQNLLKSLGQLDPADSVDSSTRRALIGGLSGMQEATLRSVLADSVDGKPVVRLLVGLLDKLPDAAAKAAAAQLLGELDPWAVRLFLKVGTQVSIDVLAQLFRGQDADSGLNAIAEAIHTLADVLRNPERGGSFRAPVFRQAIEGLQKLAEAAGEVGFKASRTLESVVEGYKAQRERGFDHLAFLADGEGRASELAQRALADLVGAGALALDPGSRTLGVRSLDALDEAAARHPSAGRELARGICAIVEQGEAGLELLRPIAMRSGCAAEAAQEALLAVVLRGGAVAQDAYFLLVGLEETGAGALARLRRSTKKHGEKAVDVLDWIARHPGGGGDAAARDAVQCLKDVAEVEERVAPLAVMRLVALADEPDSASAPAVDALADILIHAPIPAAAVVAAWRGEIGPGSRRVLDALAGMGEAASDALHRIAEGGGVLGEHAHILGGDAFDGVLDALGNWSLEPPRES